MPATSRDCLRAALAHRQPERVPVDCGSTPVTGMHVSCVAALRAHYGLAERPVKVVEPYQMLGEVDEELQRALGLDVTGFSPRGNLFDFANEGWRPYRLPWGQEVLVPAGFQTTTDNNGDLLIYPQGDRTAPPSGRLPVGGYFFDTIIRQPPLDDAALDPADNLEEFGPLSGADLAHLATQAHAASCTGRGVIGNIGGTGFGDIALVPAPFLKHPKGIRDVAEWYVATRTRREYIHAVFARQCEFALANLAAAYRVIGDQMDALFVCGTDFGTQRAPFCSLETFTDLYAPYYRRLNDWVHAHTPWKTFKHSCGAVAPLLDAMIAAGFDILNPVQTTAAGMAAAGLKERYGDRLVFWGGGIDTQKTLPFGTPEDVRREVLERCALFAPGGGFVFNTVHNIQARTPVANIAALFAALREFNGAR